MNKDKIKDKVLQKIQGINPHSKLYFSFREFASLFFILIFIILAILLFTNFLWRIGDFWILGADFNFQNFLEYIWLEILFLAVILTVVNYFLIRKTDWKIAKYRVWLLTSLLLFVFIFGSSLITIGGSNEILENQLQQSTKNLDRIMPHRRLILPHLIDNKNPGQMFFNGILIKNNQKEITVKNRLETRKFVIKKEIPNLDSFQLKPVRVFFDNQTMEVIDIKPNPLKGRVR